MAKQVAPPLPDALEAVFGFAEIPAAVQLRQVSADGPHVPDMGRRHPEGRLRQGRVFLVDGLMGGDIRKARGCADSKHARFFPDVIEAGVDGLDVDHGRGVHLIGKNVVLESTDEVGPTGDDFGFAA